MKRFILFLPLITIVLLLLFYSVASGQEWKSITTFTGKGDKTTAPFYIASNKWRINWEVKAEVEAYAGFHFFVYPEGETAMYVESISHDGSGKDTTYIYKGPGNFYIKVSAANLKSWTLSIEEGPMTEKPEKEAEGGCFIATAVYGTAFAPEINILRDFRDKVLLPNVFGEKFVGFYYENSPPAAEFISHYPILKTFVRELGIKPLVKILEATESIWD